MKERVQVLWEWYGERVTLLCGVVLVGILCFEAGVLQGKVTERAPVVLSIPATPEPSVPLPPVAPENSASLLLGIEPTVARVQDRTDCVFVGSRNSNKYHIPSCAVAKRIKPENRVCFASKEEAERRGYVPSCLK